MRIRLSWLFAAACLLAISSPAWSKNLSSRFHFDKITKIASTSLKPGTYNLIANESTGEVSVVRDGKVVAHVKGQWVSLNKKSQYNEIESNRNDIQEVLFAGQSKAIKLPS